LEKEEKTPYLVFTITDETGNVLRKITKSAEKGINRVVWDLRYYSTSPVSVKEKFNPVDEQKSSTLVLPGKYKVAMSMVTRDGVKELYGPVEFNTTLLKNTTLPADKYDELIAFQKKANEIARSVKGTENFLNDMMKKVEHIKQALVNTPEAPEDLMIRAEKISGNLTDISLKFSRDSDKPSVEETPPSYPTFNERLNILQYVHYRSTSNITQNEKNAYSILMEEFPPVLNELKRIYSVDLKNLEDDLEKYNAPWTPGRIPAFEVD
jgi:hypothetical protein